MDSFAELMRKRRSVRSYLDKPVPCDDIRAVLEAARLAPSARNRQPWHFVVVTDERRRSKLAEICGQQQFVAEAPVVVVAVATESERIMTCDIPAYPVDLSIAVTQMILAAAERGLGTCWIGYFDQEEAAKFMQIPDDHKIFTVLPLGYPADEPVDKERRPLADMVSFEVFGGSREGTK